MLLFFLGRDSESSTREIEPLLAGLDNDGEDVECVVIGPGEELVMLGKTGPVVEGEGTLWKLDLS